MWYKEFKHDNRDVAGQEVQWLKSTRTPLLPSMKRIDLCPLEHWRASWTFWKCQWTKYWCRNSKWNTCVLCSFLICSHENKWNFVSGWLQRTWRNFKIRITSIASKCSLSTNRGFTTMIANSNVKLRRGCVKRSKNTRKFGSINWRRSNWWCFSSVGGWFINTSVISLVDTTILKQLLYISTENVWS